MERHGFDTYFVVGEGLLGETDGDRTIAAASTVPPFRFSRLGPQGVGHELGDDEPEEDRGRDDLGRARLPRASPPATPTSASSSTTTELRPQVMLGQNVTPAQLLQGRSPSARPRLALRRRPAGSRVGGVLRGRRPAPQGRQRGGAGDPAIQGSTSRAGGDKRHGSRVIPDQRNDENLAVAQTHLPSSASTTASSTRSRPRCRPRRSSPWRASS